jgi:hypothetical protein
MMNELLIEELSVRATQEKNGRSISGCDAESNQRRRREHPNRRLKKAGHSKSKGCLGLAARSFMMKQAPLSSYAQAALGGTAECAK